MIIRKFGMIFFNLHTSEYFLSFLFQIFPVTLFLNPGLIGRGFREGNSGSGWTNYILIKQVQPNEPEKQNIPARHLRGQIRPFPVMPHALGACQAIELARLYIFMQLAVYAPATPGRAGSSRWIRFQS
jgi:hypothetical protein